MRATDALDKAGLRTPEAIFVKQGGIAVSYQEAVSISHRIASKSRKWTSHPEHVLPFIAERLAQFDFHVRALARGHGACACQCQKQSDLECRYFAATQTISNGLSQPCRLSRDACQK